ncbi:undecaprenyl-diphosphate phosphatase [Patescibacteria group bacterium]|nr:undecaprenyl-diphosphate phosphatase [Patescibacteria group bacterium]
MLTYFQAIVLGLLQGFSELFPISSLGHSVILPKLVGWNISQHGDTYLTFLVALHLATSLVLLGFFWKDWVRIVKGIGRSLAEREIRPSDTDARLGWLLVVGTIPAGLLGILFQDKLKALFVAPLDASILLIVNGLMLLLAERWRRSPHRTVTEAHSDERIAQTSWWHSFGIGAAQALALFPGISRSGGAMSGGLLFGLSNEDSARFAFLLATPIIGAAALLKLPQLFSSQSQLVGLAAVGGIAAAISAYLSIRFLVKYFETKRLDPFGYYSLAVGAITAVLFLTTLR